MENLLESIQRYCDVDKKNLNSILQSFADYLQMERDELRQELRRRKYHDLSEEGNPKAKTRHYYEWVALLHEFYNIPLDYFYLDNNPKLVKKLNSKSNGEIKLFPLRAFTNQQDEELQEFMEEKYFEKSIEFFDHVKEGLFVYDYLDRFREGKGTDKENYNNVHQDIFKKIESHLSSSQIKDIPNLKYVRFLALPRKNKYKREELVGVKLVNEIINNCSVALFEHLYSCLLKYPIYEKKGAKKNLNYGFYMMNFTPRTYHFAYIDDGSYCLTEQYRYNRFGSCKLDLLSIEQSKGELSKLAKAYEVAIQKMFEYDGLQKLC